MPLYEYRCEKCGRFEILQKLSDGSISACPTCGQAVERLISAPAFQFKGSGFYITDYGKGTESKDAASGSKSPDSKPSETGSGSTSKEASTPPSADSKSSTNSPPKESTASAAPALAPAATSSQ